MDSAESSLSPTPGGIAIHPAAALPRHLRWRHFIQDPQILFICAVLAGCSFFLGFFGSPLGPFFTAIVVAYLLEGMVRMLRRLLIPRQLAVFIVYTLFLLLLFLALFVFLPNLVSQLSQLLTEIPRIASMMQPLIRRLADMVSGLVEPAFAENLLVRAIETSQNLLADSVSYMIQRIPGLFSILIYLLLVPFLVFFLLKDKEAIQRGFARFLPTPHDLLEQVFLDIDQGLGGYIRGKFLELLLLGIATYWTFSYLYFEYAFLLGLLTGLSVLIPFLGVAAVTVPVVVLGLFQFGLTWDATHPFIAYAILQIVDGSIFAPIILGETMQVHPVTIVLAVLFFGSLWGPLGVFFAVPLAVVIKSIFTPLIPLLTGHPPHESVSSTPPG